jgi:glycerol uptake facilitator-like aquaporin
MLDTLARLLPPLAGPTTLVLCVLGLLASGTLWLAGDRFARPLAALCAVTIGGMVGLALPGWMDIGLSPAACSVVLALLMGLSGYALPQVWLAVSLGATLAMWGTLVCWMIVAGESEWTWPAWTNGGTVRGYLSASWQSMPVEFTRVAPFIVISLMLVGMIVSLVWRKRLMPLVCSVVGISLLTLLGLLAASIGKLGWHHAVPSATGAQVFMLLILSLFGALVQTRAKPSGEKGGKDG